MFEYINKTQNYDSCILWYNTQSDMYVFVYFFTLDLYGTEET